MADGPGGVGREAAANETVGREAAGRGVEDAIARAPSLSSALGAAMDWLEERFGARCGALFQGDSVARTVTVAAVHGMSAEDLRPRYGLGVAGRVVEGGRPLVVPSVRREPMALSELSDPAAWRADPLGLVGVPLVVGDRCVGALSVYFREESPSAFAARAGVVRPLAAALAQRMRPSRPAVIEAGVRPATPAVFEYANMIGTSAVMRQVYEEIGQVAQTTATALLLGESGTGKELVAQAIHANSDRASQPFIKMNGAAFPEALFESELFGHERGAFTGAVSRKKGRLDLAQGGTLFLDEIGDLALATQVKLLRVLQFREYERIGGTETLKADVRLVAATNKNMALAVANGTFREDLYYRLNVFTITLPPLRDRRGDVPALAEYFLEKYAREHRRRIRRIASGALDLLCQYAWPGNVRELENALERAVVVCGGVVIEERHLPPALREATTPAERPGSGRKATLAEAVEQLERRMIEDALRESEGNLARAARALGTTERILRYKVDKYDLAGLRARAGTPSKDP
jgi:Nif-specific regulatory protein